MATERRWAHRRRVMYGAGFFVLFGSLFSIIFFLYGYTPANCLDDDRNGGERGVDCGGRCARICTLDVLPPSILWVRSFHITEGQYNAVAYVENRNINSGVENLRYTIRLFDRDGLITERTGSTPFPPHVVYPIFEGRLDTGDRIPTETTIEFEEDPVWVEAEQNNEQYVTERRVLAKADSKPVLTATLKNESLDEARDVDVVAVIFDRAGNALTASRTKVPVFPPRGTKEVTFTWLEPIAKTVRSCEVPTDVVLAIDLSGSMNDDGGTPPEPVSSVLSSARAFVTGLGEEDQIAVVTYATEAKTVKTLTSARSDVARFISSLTIDPASERGSTNTGDALLRAREELSSTRHSPDARRVAIILTDGLATAPGESPEEHARTEAASLKDAGVELFTIGLGENLNEEFLRELATDPAHYFRAPTTATLGRIYSDITGAICEEGAAVIEIVPKQTATFAPVVP